MKKVCILTYDATSVGNACGVIDILHIANNLWQIYHPDAGPIFECSIVSPLKRSWQLYSGLTFQFNKGLDTKDIFDIVVIPGFIYKDIDDLLGRLDQFQESVNWIRRQYETGATIGASCSGTILLAETGLLNGKNATSSWWLDSLFRTRYPEINLEIGRMIVESGRLLTGGAVTSYFNLVLRLVEKFSNKILASLCSKMILIETNRYSQAPYMTLQTQLVDFDDVVSKAQAWIQNHIHRKIDLKELSDHLAISNRTLIRRFKRSTGETPIKYLQKIRIETAKYLLETTDLNIESIMDRVGYADVSSFSLLFKRLTNSTPREYRHQFSYSGDQGNRM